MKIRVIKSSNIAACPILSFAADHYNDDGTCKCQKERER